MDNKATIESIRSMPKTELHVHIEGTLEPELALELARRNGVELPWTTLEELREQYRFQDLQSFLDLYYQLMGVLKTAQDFHDLMLAYLKRAHEDGVRHAEPFFDPQVHMGNGIAFSTVLEGLLSGAREGHERYGITTRLIMSILRDLPVAQANELVEQAAPYAGDILALGLDSAEVGNPPSLFADAFARAGELGWHRVAHAGEEGPASYVVEAVETLHAERIDHGIHAADDPAVIEMLAAQGIALTCCPLSNLKLHVVEDVADLPIPDFIANRLVVTVNSDDPAYFGGYIAKNYEALADRCGLSLEDLAQLAGNSIAASFVDDDEREKLFSELDRWKQSNLR